ncbi:alpha-galactosidase [Virgisporangium aliadipatigenens]|uniref:Alpha-galactosidase n=1 Tax=Virgisporangium aliadipatigenens TaxID=741659 RepID=A0A8J3YER2_9ACTN|nr:lectin [Virgisporangium aliadipatigenens]GIJ43799.1 alpha-galactosidase [Virgisporangium aliadipatigenens]
MRIRRLTLSLALALSVGAVVPVVQVAAEAPAAAIDNGLARTPPMGFNNWNSTHCRAEFNEAMVKGIADIFVERGLKAAGYEYVNLDDCWALPQRNAQGDLVPDPARFPSGIKAVADYVHGKGLKFGIYTSAGTKTCNPLGFPGGLDHEDQDARLFASWGVDYLKYDNCNNQGRPAIERYTRMRDAIARTGRPMILAICEWGESEPWRWAPAVGNLWRSTGDIEDNWGSVLNIIRRNSALAAYARPGAWNDPDMLEVGNGGMTDTEYRTHFALWAMMAAPLLIGTDLRRASQATFDILTNRDLIAVDQDPAGRQAYVVANGGGAWVFSRILSNGDRAVALFNENDTAQTIATTAARVGMNAAASYTVKDLWTGTSTTTTGALSATVPAHGTAVFRISGGAAYAGHTLVSQATGQCLDIHDNIVANGTAVEIFTCNGGANQRFNLTPSGELRAYDGTRCVDVDHGGTTGGTKVLLWDCHGGANQQFRLNADGTVTAVQSGLCLDVDGAKTAPGTGIIIWDCHGQPNQRWTRG